ncbi:hypothetical protein E2C01_094013 [Portunus trituberculatus]|uniref:Uncharacterized protein n=1 Tax=Portunus trituberculatus TaxID=210409 RepID=A0A5B7JWI4_PORTR|nr:hypothetical protein [Portunus trituberculatus]
MCCASKVYLSECYRDCSYIAAQLKEHTERSSSSNNIRVNYDDNSSRSRDRGSSVGHVAGLACGVGMRDPLSCVLSFNRDSPSVTRYDVTYGDKDCWFSLRRVWRQ